MLALSRNVGESFCFYADGQEIGVLTLVKVNRSAVYISYKKKAVIKNFQVLLDTVFCVEQGISFRCYTYSNHIRFSFRLAPHIKVLREEIKDKKP